MRKDIEEARRELAATNRQADKLRSIIDAAVGCCTHAWSNTVYCPVLTQGYQDPGDPLGTMGVDRRLPSWVPGTTRKRWSRECRECGLVQFTEFTSKRRVPCSTEGVDAYADVPTFPGDRS